MDPDILAGKILGTVALFSQLALHTAHLVVLLYNIYKSDRMRETILAGGVLRGLTGTLVKRQTEGFLLKHYDKVFGPQKSLEPDSVGLAALADGEAPIRDPNAVGPFGVAMIANRAHKVKGLAELGKFVDLRVAQLRAGESISVSEILASLENSRMQAGDVRSHFARLVAESRLMPHGDDIFIKSLL